MQRKAKDTATLFGAGADFAVADIKGSPGVAVSAAGPAMVLIGLETDGALVHATRDQTPRAPP
ncbi:hypothetical protein IU436_26570 [Nocardia farcinica]|uniref:hypothetical protein n=1 Tax=Nocardia TaxID=1817 RepID=UPI001893C14A|nr:MULTISPECIES: hypothetical protein [Nocardia]MBF6290167.1 hypothetical protein [Nocardia cyriacigeorgica]MBF6422255.1 hypothetical protein [Nocardia farcinica]MBF6433911.1 hypothetical protein [Nocardia farcinica]MBF6504979.1 hypothetical protein [Nocardia farcinica]